MPCLPRGLAIAGSLLLTLTLAAGVAAQGWRPASVDVSDAEWIKRLDARLAPIHGKLADTVELVGTASDREADAYLVILQEQAVRGILVLDGLEPAPTCARDYMAAERVMFLQFGDLGDAWVQYRAGSQQAAAEVGALAQSAIHLLRQYGDTLRNATTCGVPAPEPSPVASHVPATTATPAQESE